MAAAGRGPPRQRWLSGGVRRRAAHSRPAGSSGERGRAPARGSPWAITATSARSRWRRQSSGLSPGRGSCSFHARGRPSQGQRAGASLPPSTLRCRLDPQPFALLGGSPAWRPREVHENTGRATPEFSIRAWRGPRVRISDAPRWCRRSGAHAEDTARFIPRRPTPDSPAPSLKRRLVLDANSITAPQVPRAAGPTRPGGAGTVASAVSPPYRLPPGFPTRRFCS